MAKSKSTQSPLLPHGDNANPHLSLTPSISSASVAVHQPHLAADLRRDKSSSSFTPAPVISGPIPPLPKRNHNHTQIPHDTSANLRDREYYAGSARRPPSRETSGGSTTPSTSVMYPLNLTPPGMSYSPTPNGKSLNESYSPQSPTSSVGSSLSPSSASHFSSRSASTATTHITPKGSSSNLRSEISNPILQHSPNSNAPPLPTMYSIGDDHKGGKNGSAADFHLERPSDDRVIEQMFNDLIVSSVFVFRFSLVFTNL